MAVLFVVSPESAGSVGRTIHSVPTTGFEKCICTIRHRPSRFSSTPVQRALVHEANAIPLTPDVEAETTAKFVAPNQLVCLPLRHGNGFRADQGHGPGTPALRVQQFRIGTSRQQQRHHVGMPAPVGHVQR